MSASFSAAAKPPELRRLVVGAAGRMYMLHRLRSRADARSTSRAMRPAATWYCNRYPARAAMSKSCNIPIRSRKSLRRRWDGASATRRSPKSLK